MKITNISKKTLTNYWSRSPQFEREEKYLEISCLVEYLGNKKIYTIQSVDYKDERAERGLFVSLINKIIDEYGFCVIESIEV